MRMSVVVDQSTSFIGRLALAFVELTLATAVIVGAIVAGHNLREWRDWYATTYHPWLESQRTTQDVTEP
ncbi:MAG TPA: hypothetical protein VGS01_13010 [Candidatus Limnocylindria bacterium]|jgi:hypothetical protein|nr:hypothetical protein [Candidatus Limnocylindria bacterium]